MDKKKFLIIDTNALIHRAFHALPPLTNKKGEVVNAVYGFLLMFLKAIQEFEPNYIAACFDMPGPTFRHKEYKEYKATRVKAPDELYEQIPKIKKFLDVFKISIFEKQGFEADDVIASIAEKTEKKGINTIILTGDLDILQLVDKDTNVYAMRKGIKDMVLYDESKVLERYGLSPTQVVDLKALMGDSSDNIPGVPGIGIKTASELLQQFGTLDNVYKEVSNEENKTSFVSVLAHKSKQTSLVNLTRSFEIKPRIKKLLLEYRKQAFLSQRLAQIKKDVVVDFNLGSCEYKGYNKKEVLDMFQEYGFKSLAERLAAKKQNVLFGK